MYWFVIERLIIKIEKRPTLLLVILTNVSNNVGRLQLFYSSLTYNSVGGGESNLA